MKQIYRCIFGSHLYGTNTETSDTDYKSVFVPDAESILLQRVKSSTGHKISRSEGEKNTTEDTDDEAYSLQEYLKLLAQGQTVAIDMLFVPKPICSSQIWTIVFGNRHRLLTKKSAAFLGYCRQQANKYGIKGSRVEAARKATEFFAGRIEKLGYQTKVGEVSQDLPTGEHAFITAKETSAGNIETYYECCNRMVGLKNTIKEAYNIFSKIYENYGERARLAQKNEGIDWKALSHAVRVGREALELLSTGEIKFPLPYAPHLVDIKKGRLTYAEVSEEIENLLWEVEKEAKVSFLRDEPDYTFIDNLVKVVYAEEVVNWVRTQ